MKKFSKWMALLLVISSCLSASLSFAQTPSDTVFQKLGGKEGIDNIAAELVSLVLKDVRIKDTFKDVDTDRLKEKLAEQFCELSGGPCKYSGKDMTTIHQDLAISNAQFNALAEDLQIAMDKFNIASRVQNKLIARLAPMQRNIVTK